MPPLTGDRSSFPVFSACILLRVLTSTRASRNPAACARRLYCGAARAPTTRSADAAAPSVFAKEGADEKPEIRRPSALHREIAKAVTPSELTVERLSSPIERPYSHVAASAQPRDRRCALRKRTIGGGASSSVGNPVGRASRSRSFGGQEVRRFAARKILERA